MLVRAAKNGKKYSVYNVTRVQLCNHCMIYKVIT